MTNVEVIQRENKDLRIKQWFIRIEKKFWFIGKEIALALKYTNPREEIRNHIDSKDKEAIEKLLGKNFREILRRNFSSRNETSLRDNFFQDLEINQKLVSELGLISFCTRSRKSRAVLYQRWVYQTMQELKETGPYRSHPENLSDLITKIETLERKIEASREKKRVCDRETQTQKSVIVLDGSFRDLEDRIIKALKKNKLSIKRSIKEIRLDLEKYSRRTSSSSCSSSSPHQLYYSSDSD